MDIAAARFLTGPRGQRALAAARAGRDVPAHRRATFLEDLGTRAEIRAVLVQDDLRARAGARCPHAERLLFTPAALEQATAWAVAEERATRWPASEAPVADLGAGIGLDALAAALAGRAVTAFERDPVRAHLLGFNAGALGLAERVQVRAEDARGAAAGDSDQSDQALADSPMAGRGVATQAYLDPDRRPDGQRTRDAEAFEPPASTWEALLGRFERAMIKLPPAPASGSAGDALPTAYRDLPFEVVSLGGRARERRLFVGDWPDLPPRRALALPASALRDGAQAEAKSVSGSGQRWPAARAPVEGDWLLDPDVAVVLAGLVGDLAARDGLVPLHPEIAYLLAPAPVSAAPGHWMRIDASLAPKPKAINAWLAAHGIGNLTLRKRGVEDKVAVWRGRLRPKGPNAGTLVFTRDLRDRWTVYGCLDEDR